MNSTNLSQFELVVL